MNTFGGSLKEIWVEYVSKLIRCKKPIIFKPFLTHQRWNMEIKSGVGVQVYSVESILRAVHHL